MRRGATYYHRAAVPKDIVDTYGKTEEVTSLRTKDRAEAARRSRIKDVQVDEMFEAHRRSLIADSAPALQELTKQQIDHIKSIYFSYILEEDEEKRLSGFDEFTDEEGERFWESDRPDLPRETFEEHQANQDSFSGATKAEYARGKVDEFIRDEAEEVLSWDGINLRLPKWSGRTTHDGCSPRSRRKRNEGDLW